MSDHDDQIMQDAEKIVNESEMGWDADAEDYNDAIDLVAFALRRERERKIEELNFRCWRCGGREYKTAWCKKCHPEVHSAMVQLTDPDRKPTPDSLAEMLERLAGKMPIEGFCLCYRPTWEKTGPWAVCTWDHTIIGMDGKMHKAPEQAVRAALEAAEEETKTPPSKNEDLVQTGDTEDETPHPYVSPDERYEK